MSVRRLAPAEIQPPAFAFTAENADWAKGQIAKYPEGRQASAVIPLLWRAQEQSGGWVPQKAIEHVADMLGMAHIRVLEVATFYTMFNLEPVGRYHVQLCGTTPCMLRGAEDLKKICHKRIGDQFHVTKDGKFSWVEVECLGACVNAPMVQINYDFYEDLTPDSLEDILDQLAAGIEPKPGPQIDRQFSAPVGGPTTLIFSDDGAEPQQEGAALADAEAKRPGKPASDRASPTPKPPLGEGAIAEGAKGKKGKGS
jgi:NADH-quinone oxidoreductase subunit E